MGNKIESNASKSDNVPILTFSKKQLEQIFERKESSDLTLVSEDKQVYYARWTVLQVRWMWLGGLKNAEQARNVNEGDNKTIEIPIPGKMLYAILMWTYQDTLDLTAWTFDEVRVFIEKCKEFELPELEEMTKNQFGKMVMEGVVEPREIRQIFEHGAKVGDEELMDKVVRISIDRMEALVNTEEFSSFPPELVAKMAGGLTEDMYPMFMRSMPKWSATRSSKEVDVVMSKIHWSAVPDELVSKLVSRYAWDSDEVTNQLEKWTICEKNESPGEKELILTVDHLSFFQGFGSLSPSADLFSSDRFFDSNECICFYLKNKMNCEKISWNCQSGHMKHVKIFGDNDWFDANISGNSASFSAQNISDIIFVTTKGALINNIRLTLS